MRIVQKYSSEKLLPSGNIDFSDNQNMYFPWELECFTTLAIKATDEYDNTDIYEKNERYFHRMMSEIRQMDSAHLSSLGLEKSMTSLKLSQFYSQEYSNIRFYRFNYIFNYVSSKIDVQSKFKDVFKGVYEQFVLITMLSNVLYGSLSSKIDLIILNKFLLNLISKKYNNILDCLKISYKDYRNYTEDLVNDVEDILYSIHVSYQYPFIVHKETVYFPLPHILNRVITDSFLFRLTHKDDPMRSNIGKYVLEDYLYKILSNSNCYDCVLPEQTYKLGRQEIKSSDVLVRKNKDIIYFENKEFSPNPKLRIGNNEEYTKTTQIVADAMIQVVKNLVDYYEINKLNPFSELDIVSKDNRWGIVIFFENNYIELDNAYKIVADEFHYEVNSCEYEWLITHIKILSLYDVERYSLSKVCLLDYLKDENNINSYYQIDLNVGDIKDDEYLSFFNNLDNQLKAMISDIEKYGI